VSEAITYIFLFDMPRSHDYFPSHSETQVGVTGLGMLQTTGMLISIQQQLKKLPSVLNLPQLKQTSRTHCESFDFLMHANANLIYIYILNWTLPAVASSALPVVLKAPFVERIEQRPFLLDKPLQTSARRPLGLVLSCLFTGVGRFTRPWIAS
jgi:hypothetical protein